MAVLKKIFIFVVFFIAICTITYQLGVKKGLSLNKNSKSNQQLNDDFKCPYVLKINKYHKYLDFANDLVILGKPQLIENPEVIRINEPFNQIEFQKNLYKLSNDKGWDERNFDVDNDGKKERIISANIAMNHTPHIGLILKDNRIVFKAEGANILIKETPTGMGFTLEKTIDWNIGEKETIRYIPKDGGFIPIWRQKSCLVRFE